MKIHSSGGTQVYIFKRDEAKIGISPASGGVEARGKLLIFSCPLLAHTNVSPPIYQQIYTGILIDQTQKYMLIDLNDQYMTKTRWFIQVGCSAPGSTTSFFLRLSPLLSLILLVPNGLGQIKIIFGTPGKVQFQHMSRHSNSPASNPKRHKISAKYTQSIISVRIIKMMYQRKGITRVGTIKTNITLQDEHMSHHRDI